MKRLFILLVGVLAATVALALGPGDPIQNGYVWHDSNVAIVTRNSANNATDDDMQNMHTYIIPPGVARAGDVITVAWNWANTNSANTKEVGVLVGSVVGPAKLSTAVASHHTVHQFILDSANTLRIIDAQTGFSVDATSFLAGTNSGGNWENGFTLSVRCRWATQPIAGESITFYSSSVNISRQF